MAAVWRRKLRVRMYTGFGGPVDPEVKVTSPGVLRKNGLCCLIDEMLGLGTGCVSSPMVSPSGARCRRVGGRKRGVAGGMGGELRQALGSGPRTMIGTERLERAKKRATA
jgi:hypothetical protein